MTRGENAELLQHIVRDLGDAYPGINLTDGGCQWRSAHRLHAGLRAENLAHTWAFLRAHRDQNDAQIRDNEAA